MPHIARNRCFLYDFVADARCKAEPNLAEMLPKSLKTHAPTEPHIAALYPAIVRLCFPSPLQILSMTRQAAWRCDTRNLGVIGR